MELNVLFPSEQTNVSVKKVKNGKSESDGICFFFEKYSNIEVESDNLIINLWRGSCCCLLGCCDSCVGYEFISKINNFFKWFYCHKKIIISQNEIVDVGYIFSGIRINEEWKYWPVLALKNKQLIIIGIAEEMADLTETIFVLRKKLNIEKDGLYEIPNIYKNNIL